MYCAEKSDFPWADTVIAAEQICTYKFIFSILKGVFYHGSKDRQFINQQREYFPDY